MAFYSFKASHFGSEEKGDEVTEEVENGTKPKELARPNIMADDDPGAPMVEVPEDRDGDPQTVEEDEEGWKKWGRGY